MARTTFPFHCRCGTLVTSKASICFQCQRDYRIARKAKLKDGELNPVTKAGQVYRAKHPKTYLLCNPRLRAKQKGWEFNLTQEDIIIPEYCPVLKVKLDPVGSGGSYTPSVDRIDSTKGYIKGNIRIVSHRANTLLNDGSLEEHKLVYEFLLEQAKRGEDEDA